MRPLAVVAASTVLLAAPCLGADLDAAKRMLATQPERALAIAREAIAADAHDAKAHALEVRALRLLGRSAEAIPPLDAWAAEVPGDIRPLWILLDVDAGLHDWAAVAKLPARAAAAPEDSRRDLLRSIALAQLDGERYVDARSTLTMAPPPGDADPAKDLFDALAGSAAGDLGAAARALERYLVSGIDDHAQDRILWWTAELAELSRASAGPTTPAAEGFVVRKDVGAPAVLPTGDITLPTLVRKGPVEYPEGARRARREGKVTVQTTVLTTGHVAFPEVLASTDPEFNESARRALPRWRYVPAKKDGRPLAVYYVIVIKYSL